MSVFDHRKLGGLSVRRAANRFIRFFQIESNLMRVLGGWTARIDDSAIRLRWARHLNQDAFHADALRRRIQRMRTLPEMIPVPDESFRELFEKINEAPDLPHFLAAIYLFVKPHLVGAYRRHVAEIDPLADELSARCLTPIIAEEQEQIRWGEQALEACVGDDGELRRAVLRFVDELELAATHQPPFLLDSEEVPETRSDESASHGTGFWKMRRPPASEMKMGREFRIATPGEAVSHCPPYQEFSDPEQRLMLVHHGLMPEHSSLAITGNILYEFDGMPWEFYLDFAIQTGDEERHILLLLKRLEELGGGPDSFPFPDWTFYDLLVPLSMEDRITVFNAVVEGDVVESLHERIQLMRELGDEQTAHLMDWICADESLHMLNGLKWIRRLRGADDLTVDLLLDHGQRLLIDLLARTRSSQRSYDSAAELSDEDREQLEAKKRAVSFYHQRSAPVAPIVRQLGGFSPKQIEKLKKSAGGKSIEL